jgi:PTS system mannose-specific IIA component
LSNVGIVLAAHGDLAQALLDSASLIVGEVDGVATIALDPTMNLETMILEMESAINLVDQGQGTLILLDLFGGTPCNAATICIQRHNGLAITGVNLPMMLEVLMQRDSVASKEDLMQVAHQAGGAGIVDVKRRFEEQSESP